MPLCREYRIHLSKDHGMRLSPKARPMLDLFEGFLTGCLTTLCDLRYPSHQPRNLTAEGRITPNLKAGLVAEALREGGPRWVKSRGRCHGELIPDGAEILLEPFGEAPPRVGEIAAYINPDGLQAA